MIVAQEDATAVGDRRLTVTSVSHVGAPHLITLGDLVLDVVITGDRAVERGSDVPGSVRFRAGGSAANTARAFAQLGGRASFIGAVGRDDWGSRLVRALRAEGVTARAVRVDGATARIAAFVGADGQRSFVTERAAADGLAAGDVRASWLRGATALHLPAYSLFAEPLSGAAARAVSLVREAGGVVSVDLASRAPLLALGRPAARRMIEAVAPDILFATADEASALFRKRPEQRLIGLAPLVVIKAGPAGCRVLARSQRRGVDELVVPTRAIAVTDTTGAGDAFDAGFLLALIGSRSPGHAPPGDGSRRPWTTRDLRRAAIGGHRSARQLLLHPRAEILHP